MAKIIGSKVEREFRAELISGNESFFKANQRFEGFLEKLGHRTANAYILHWHPDQGSIFYTLLIEGTYILDIEFDKTARGDEGESAIVERQELQEYRNGLSKMHQIRLAVALDLVKRYQNNKGD